MLDDPRFARLVALTKGRDQPTTRHGSDRSAGLNDVGLPYSFHLGRPGNDDRSVLRIEPEPRINPLDLQLELIAWERSGHITSGGAWFRYSRSGWTAANPLTGGISIPGQIEILPGALGKLVFEFEVRGSDGAFSDAELLESLIASGC